MERYGISVSDGSFENQFGTTAFIIKSDDPQKDMFGVNIAPRHPKDQSSLRRKLLECFGAVATVQAICKQYGICEGVIVLACDNIEALHWSVDMNFFVSP